MSERLRDLFVTGRKLLSIFVTAGFPRAEDTIAICEQLQDAGVDFIELGIPFSDSVADGPTIQNANTVALENGMTVAKSLDLLRAIRRTVSVPIVLMGSINPILSYGVEKFCDEAVGSGADGAIFPDLPPEYYEKHFADIFDSRGFASIFLISPRSDEERIRKIDSISRGFIYAVSGPGVTGGSVETSDGWREYLDRIRAMGLKSPLMVGFGIENDRHMQLMCEYADGVIVGSAFLRAIASADNAPEGARDFIDTYFPRSSR